VPKHGSFGPPRKSIAGRSHRRTKLIEFLIANITAKLDGVLSNHFAEVIRPLKRVARLRKLSFKVVAETEPAGNTDERYSFAVGAEFWVNPEVFVAWIAEAGAGGNRRSARVLHQVRALGM